MFFLNKNFGSVLIVGYGREGKSVHNYLNKCWEGEIFIFDDDDNVMAKINEKNIFDNNILSSVGLIIVSPGISPSHNLLVKAKQLDIKITTGTNLFLDDKHKNTIAVTGSKGKSTTSSLIFHIMKSLGYDVKYGGNIGNSLLDLGGADWYIAEISSYQASYVEKGSYPKTVVLTSLFPDHVDWHGSVSKYYEDKLNLIGENSEDFQNLIVNLGDEILMRELSERMIDSRSSNVYNIRMIEGEETLMRFDTPVMKLCEVKLMGWHNYVNISIACNAIEATVGVVNGDELVKALKSFTPLPHRLEVVYLGKHVWVDDLLATTPNATAVSLQSIRGKYNKVPIYLIVGGMDRGLENSFVLGEAIVEAGNVVVFSLPDNGSKVCEPFKNIVPIIECENLENAINYIKKQDAGVVLLSPAAPSYNLYSSYKQKSEAFLKSIIG